MGKAKKKKPAAPAASAAPAVPAVTGPSRVLLLRHGQSEANSSGKDVPDAMLTSLGRVQAAADVQKRHHATYRQGLQTLEVVTAPLDTRSFSALVL